MSRIDPFGLQSSSSYFGNGCIDSMVRDLFEPLWNDASSALEEGAENAACAAKTAAQPVIGISEGALGLPVYLAGGAISSMPSWAQSTISYGLNRWMPGYGTALVAGASDAAEDGRALLDSGFNRIKESFEKFISDKDDQSCE